MLYYPTLAALLKQLLSRKTIVKGVLISLVVVGLVTTLHYFNVFKRNEWIAYDWMLKRKNANIPVSKDIALILIDDASLQYMDAIAGRWPWPREVFADVIDYVSIGSPKAILFDILFVEQQRDPTLPATRSASDQRLVTATQNVQHVYHAMQFIADKEDEVNKGLLHAELPHTFASRFALTPHLQAAADNSAGSEAPPFEHAKLNNFLIPFDGLFQAATGIGVVSVNEDEDGVLRRTALTHYYQGHHYPALSISALNNRSPQNTHSQNHNDRESAYSGELHIKDNQLFVDEQSIPMDQDGLFLINMHSQFNTYSMSGLLASVFLLHQGEVENLLIDPEEFNDKYVFIGASAIGLHDLKVTPISNNQPGVMVHASTLANILQSNFLQPPSLVTTLMSIIVVSLLTTIGLLNCRSSRIKILFPLLIICAFWAWVSWQFYFNQVVEMVPPFVSIALSWAATYVYLHFTEEKEKNKIRKMFSQYVSPAALTVMVDQYEDYTTAHQGSKEEVSVLFSDIRGFTTISENIAAESVVEILNYYFSVMTRAVHNHHGTIDKFIGDAIMAIWGAPVKSTGHAAQALNAALEMIKQLDNINQWLAARHYDPIDIGIGINSGEVILGSIGSEQKADYTVIGDNVNLASRLEGATKIYGCNIIISEYTYTQLNDTPCMIVDLVRVKGRQCPIKLYTPVLTGATSEISPEELALLSAQAFDAYLNRYWKDAMHSFEKLPNRTLGKLYATRCKQYKRHPPPKDWDGVYSIRSK